MVRKSSGSPALDTTGEPQVSMLALNRLDRRDRTALVEQIASGKAIPEEVIAQIVERTDGVPLFVEELTKTVLESGAPLVGIPATLHDSLMARLDRLASVRAVAQTAAAIGREFPYGLLQAVSRLPEHELQAALKPRMGPSVNRMPSCATLASSALRRCFIDGDDREDPSRVLVQEKPTKTICRKLIDRSNR
jgi:hypothetical protein